jgi:hypothetical protein
MARRGTAKSALGVHLPGRAAGELALSFAGNVIKHLGVQMYAGRPVPAIAELISNAWDADATEVRVRIPLDQTWHPTNQNQIIEVADDGNGMNWEMVRDAYLDVGRDRRDEENTDKSPGGRPLQGRKGIGKLAGFGIADVLEVQTVAKSKDPSIHEKALIWFRLDLAKVRRIKKGGAPVSVIFAGPVSEAPTGARKTSGTTVILRRLHDRRAQATDRFHHSMAERFLLLGPKFRVRINGKDLRAEDIKLQWRWPKTGWRKSQIAGCGPVQYWIGFTRTPRKQNEGELSGILIYTRGKVSQEATNFEISGGVTGQHGLRYMVGMVRAEWLDTGIHGTDFIATPRDSIAWESPQGEALKEWGQRLVRKSLADWAKRRTRLRERQIKEVSPKIAQRIERLAPSYKDVALEFVDKFKSVEMEPSEFEEIFSWFLDALENATLRSILQKLRTSDINDLQQLDDLLSKMEVRTAVTLLQIIDSNLATIDTLERLHREDAKERGVLSRHLETNAWLIDPTWMLSKAEARVATWIKRKFGLKETGKVGDLDRVDFFCVAVGGTLHIVEIKRGAHAATTDDILQAAGYRTYVLDRFRELTDPKAIKYVNVQSHLISATLRHDAGELARTYASNGFVLFTTWDDLIERAKHSHTQFREILQKKASEDDRVADDLSMTKASKHKKKSKKAGRKK